MSLQTGPTRVLVVYSRPENFVDKTQAILARLGYIILTPEEFEARAKSDLPPDSPHLYLADERQLADLPQEGDDAERPIILLTGRAGASGEDPRIVAAVRRPAGLHDLYCILQRLFEMTPRATPRIPVRIEASCAHGGQTWAAELVSMSENGGLLRSDTSLPLGSTFGLTFDLPDAGVVEIEAEAAYQIVPDFGVVFSGIDALTRNVIADFVSSEILR